MKRTALLIGMMVIGIALVSAQGFAGQRQTGGGIGGPGFGTATDTEEIELTGRLRLADGEFPVLIAEGTEYTLHIAPALAAEIEVSNNQQVTVEGYAVENPSFDLLGSDAIVRVRTIEIGNDRYILPTNTHGPRVAAGGMAGPRDGAPGTMGSRGGAPGMMGPRFDDDDYGRRFDDDNNPQAGRGRR